MRNTEEKDDENNKGWRGTHVLDNMHIFVALICRREMACSGKNTIFQEHPVCLV